MFKWLISSAIFFAVLSSVLLTSSFASAATIFDDTVQTTDNLEIRSYPTGTHTNDLSTSMWAQINTSCPNGTALQSQFNSNALAWTIVKNAAPTPAYGDSVSIVWTEDLNDLDDVMFNDVNGNGTDMQINVFANASINLYREDDGDWLCSEYVADQWSQVARDPHQNSTGHPFIFVQYGYTWDWPTGYEGEIPDETYTPPTPPLDWTPDINHVQSVDWKIKLQDRNFNTFDPVPFTCNEGLTPVIQYDLFNNDTSEEIDTGIFSPTIQYEFQAEKYGTETEFKFIGNYYCGDLEDDPTFSGQTTYYFTLNASGTFVADTPSCFTEEFPFVDMDGCTAVIEGLLNNLSFGAINFPDWNIASDGCHELGPMGDWINVPDSSRTICPQFSSTVRNTVTPFLTFVLGITILGVLVTKSKKDFQ